MAGIIDDVNDHGRNPVLQPLFITCDPNRDDPASLKKYLAGTHPDPIPPPLTSRISPGYRWVDGDLGRD
jgi:SCO1/SenC